MIEKIISALLIGVGLATSGFFVGDGISNRNAGRRIISVKGLAEREVPSSLAIWTISYSASGNDIASINRKLGESSKVVAAFLKEAGFDEKDVALQPPALHDLSLQPREENVPPPPERYRAEQSVLLRTTKVDAIKPALAAASNLMVNGVLLCGGARPTYVFNQLNDIKPGMIQEATKNARIAGEQFARDSQTALGKLRNASQGWFQVEDRDPGTPERKTVRVVVDVDYEVN